MEDQGCNDPGNRSWQGFFINIEVARLKKGIAMGKPTLQRCATEEITRELQIKAMACMLVGPHQKAETAKRGPGRGKKMSRSRGD